MTHSIIIERKKVPETTPWYFNLISNRQAYNVLDFTLQ